MKISISTLNQDIFNKCIDLIHFYTENLSGFESCEIYFNNELIVETYIEMDYSIVSTKPVIYTWYNKIILDSLNIKYL